MKIVTFELPPLVNSEGHKERYVELCVNGSYRDSDPIGNDDKEFSFGPIMESHVVTGELIDSYYSGAIVGTAITGVNKPYPNVITEDPIVVAPEHDEH